MRTGPKPSKAKKGGRAILLTRFLRFSALSPSRSRDNVRGQERNGGKRKTMSSTSSILSWCSPSLYQSFAGATNKSQKSLNNGKVVLTVVAQKKVKKVRKVILKEDMPDLGKKKGELLKVRAGFYRNFLLPMGKAQLVTPTLLKEMKMEEERIEAEKERVKEEAQQLARILETVGAFKIKRKGGKGKQIFGSVTAQDLVDIIKAQLQRDVDKKIVSLPEIRETGEYVAELKLHPEVIARVRINVYAN